MYPCGSENHKKGYCADGARQLKRKGEDDIPDWPRPHGIYAKGTQFRLIKSLKTLRDMYERVVVHGERSTDLPVEYRVQLEDVWESAREEDDPLPCSAPQQTPAPSSRLFA